MIYNNLEIKMIVYVCLFVCLQAIFGFEFLDSVDECVGPNVCDVEDLRDFVINLKNKILGNFKMVV